MPGPLASFLSDFWEDQLVSHGRQGTFLVLVGFLGSFAFIRMSTRIMRSPRMAWWPGSVVSDGGVHLHHLVFGICAMMGGGVLAIGLDVSPWWEIAAALFGIGVGLTIDEFALWVHLDDVYWSREGRTSIDAAILAAIGIGLVFLGVQPFDVGTQSTAEVVASLVVIALDVALVVICFLKQRLWAGWIGLFFPPLAIYGAWRIGKPRSWWARRRYGERDPAKQARSERRFPPDRRTERFKDAVRDALGGTPSDVYEAKLAERRARDEAARTMKARADRRADLEAESVEGPRAGPPGPPR